MQELLNLCDHRPRVICDFDRERRLQLLLSCECLPDLVDLLLSDPEACPYPALARPSKADAGRFVPDDVVGPEVLDQHEHVKRIGHGVERASVVSADEVGVAAVQRHLDIDRTPVGVPSGDADSGPQKRRPVVDQPSDVALEPRVHGTIMTMASHISQTKGNMGHRPPPFPKNGKERGIRAVCFPWTKFGV